MAIDNSNVEVAASATEAVPAQSTSGKPGKKKAMGFLTLGLMAFMTVWGFANILNGFYYFNGTHSIFFWIVVFVLYFIPYALMVGELGSAFKTYGGGVSDWVAHTVGPNMGFLAGWTYFAVHVPYLVTKANNAVVGVSWALFQNNFISGVDVRVFSACGVALFVLAYLTARRGVKLLGRISSIAGTAMFVISIMFIVVMVGWVIASPEGQKAVTQISPAHFTPIFSVDNLLNLSILIFAVGGIEKIAPYVNQTDNPRDFTRGVILSVVMVNVCAILGTIAMGLMFDSDNIPADMLTNGAYYAFQLLGAKVGVGNLFVIAYAIMFIFTTFSVIVLSIDAPIRVFLNDSNRRYVNKWFYKKNKHGVFINAYRVEFVIVVILLIIPALGIPNVDGLIKWLIKMNSITMPLRYLWVFVAYIALKKAIERYKPEYTFVKNKTLGIVFGVWCFAVTAFACIMGIYSDSLFEMMMNLSLMVVLIAVGVVFILLAKRKGAVPAEK